MVPPARFCMLPALWALPSPLARADPGVRRPKVVVAMFAYGADNGDAPGEFQFWVERENLGRVIVLRTASDGDSQWPGATAAESMAGERRWACSACRPALEAPHAVGRRVVHRLAEGLKVYEDTPPGTVAQ